MNRGSYTAGQYLASTHGGGAGVLWDALFDANGNLAVLVNNPDDVGPLLALVNKNVALEADLARAVADRRALLMACESVSDVLSDLLAADALGDTHHAEVYRAQAEAVAAIRRAKGGD